MALEKWASVSPLPLQRAERNRPQDEEIESAGKQLSLVVYDPSLNYSGQYIATPKLSRKMLDPAPVGASWDSTSARICLLEPPNQSSVLGTVSLNTNPGPRSAVPAAEDRVLQAEFIAELRSLH